MNWQEIVREQYEELAMAAKVAQGKNPNIAKAILDDAEKKIKKPLNNKPDKDRDELQKVVDKIKNNPKAPISPQEKSTLDKMSEAKDFRTILADNELIELDEALFGKDYVRYSYTYRIGKPVIINGIGELSSGKIKVIGFETFKDKEGKSVKIVPTSSTLEASKVNMEKIKEDIFKKYFETYKTYPLVKSVEV